jgi:hypothetical protein
MKKLEPSSSHTRIEGIRVNRDDIDFIVEIFRRDVGPPKFYDDHFEFESLNEFIEHRGTNPKKFEIESRSPDETYRNISVKFELNSAWLYGTRDTPFLETKELLKSKSSLSFSVLSPWLWAFILMLGSSALIFLGEMAKKKQETIPEWSLYLLGAPIALIALSIVHQRINFGVQLTRTHEGGFWRRNAEKIALTLVGAVIGSGVTLLSKFLE